MTDQDHAVRAGFDAAVMAAGARLSTPLRLQLHHVAALAAERPAVQLVWVPPMGLAHGVLQRHGAAGVALLRAETAVMPAIASQDDILTAMHEVGHHRHTTWRTSSTLQREVAAWRFAADRSLLWDAAAHESMARALANNCAEVALRDLPAVAEAEALCSPASFTLLEKSISPAALEAFELLEFERRHGTQKCRRGDRCYTPGRRAVVEVDGAFFCCRCAGDIEMDQRLALLREDRR